MSKNVLIIIGCAVVVIIAVYLLIIFRRRALTASGLSSDKEKTDVNYAVFPLSRGSTGNEVRIFQTYYNENFPSSPQLVVDGIFGPKTEAAVHLVFGTSSINAEQFNSIA